MIETYLLVILIVCVVGFLIGIIILSNTLGPLSNQLEDIDLVCKNILGFLETIVTHTDENYTNLNQIPDHLINISERLFDINDKLKDDIIEIRFKVNDINDNLIKTSMTLDDINLRLENIAVNTNPS